MGLNSVFKTPKWSQCATKVVNQWIRTRLFLFPAPRYSRWCVCVEEEGCWQNGSLWLLPSSSACSCFLHGKMESNIYIWPHNLRSSKMNGFLDTLRLTCNQARLLSALPTSFLICLYVEWYEERRQLHTSDSRHRYLLSCPWGSTELTLSMYRGLLSVFLGIPAMYFSKKKKALPNLTAE